MKHSKIPYVARRVTINDVSQALGISKGTVSRALNGYPDIAKTTKNKVRKMANKMGYRPLLQAQSINRGLSYSLGLVLNTEHTDHHKAFLSDFIDGVSHALKRENWSLVVATVDDERAEYQLMQNFIQMRKVDGFIIPRVRFEDTRVRLLESHQVPFVLFGRPIDKDDTSRYNWFDICGENAMYDALHRLYVLGHRHIGFMGGDSQCTYSALRLNGYKDALNAHQLPYVADWVCADCCCPQSGYANAVKMFSIDEPPTALVCALDRSALGVYDFAQQYGLSIGEDLSIIGYDGVIEGAYVKPRLTTFAVDRKYSGHRLASILLDVIKDNAIDPVQDTVDAVLQQGQSCGMPTKTPMQIARIIAMHQKGESA